ncbi:MAG: bifunctional folylpolyglutamate synthase/dihydrofolate synthase [Peptococcaceae bacterium]|nr:MAG: bifunctional folylpolyglutamate synthase/dihydrofolate synthase [Peptococcaceae bacterium]
MDYQEAVRYLEDLTKFGFNFGLGRITELLRRLGNPHHNLRVIHVGGTNGKGSTAAMLASILQKAGYRVGTFTSPHLHSYTERYCINGVEISRKKVAKLVKELKPHLEAMVAEGFEHPTEFEVSTAMAFRYFSDEAAELLILEVGLGGAIDSTNVVTPLVAVITNVSMDHMDYLGRTVSEIAAVKAGIVKDGVPLVTAAGDGEALAVITAVCREKNAPLVLVGRDLTWRTLAESTAGQRFAIRGRHGAYDDLWLPLIGRHQQVNAATAVAVAEILSERGFVIPDEAIRDGLATTRWPARLEIMGREPMLLLDSAHNYDGIKSLRQALADYFPGKPVVLVLGMLGDKERSKVVAEIAPAARAVIVTRPNSPRAGDWWKLADEAQRYVPEVYVNEDIAGAIEQARAMAGPEEMVCITGSIYMVAEARGLLVKFNSEL